MCQAYRQLVVILCLVPWLTCESAWAEKPGHGRGEYFNVRDFGAQGDGSTDDTKAITDAINAANGVHWSIQPPGASYYISAPTVFIPSGRYMISDTLPAGHANVLGEGSSIIHQKDPEKDIFSGTGVWRWKISGLTLYGGRHHLYIGNPNIDGGQFVIDRCTFQKAGGVAINIRPGTPSSQLIVKNCIFIHNIQVLINHCDQGVLADSWISCIADMKNKAVIENYNTLHIENILGVPHVDHMANQRWIDNYSALTCRHVRFGGEDGGFTAVFNFAPPTRAPRVVASYVILDACTFYTARNDKVNSAIYLEEVPNQLIVRDSSGFISGGNRGFPVVKVSPKIDLDTYFDDVPAGSIRILIDRTLTTVIHEDDDYFTDLPPQLRPYQVNEIVADARPTKGIWRRGQLVRNRNSEGRWAKDALIGSNTQTGQGMVHISDETGSRDVPRDGREYTQNKQAATEAPYGWYCTESGKPGKWRQVRFAFTRPAEPPASQPTSKEDQP